MRARGVGRALLRRLVDGGLADPEALRTAGRDAVAAVLKHKAALTSLWPTQPQVQPAAPPAQLTDEPPQPTLIVDLSSRRVTYRGHPIPTRPPNHLQRQSVLALAVLAARPGKVVTMSELATEMQKLSGNGRRVVAPELREIRYKVIRPFRRALADVVPANEIEDLFENIPGTGLRLNAPGGARVIAA
jgi:DNA-binding response OmpR family regulator